MKFLTRSMIAAATAATVVTATAVPAHAIVGGTDATRSYSGMAAVHVYFPTEGTALCGGTLVAPDWLLTAAHCVSDDTVAPTPVAMPGANVTLRIGSDDRTTGGITATGTQVYLDPDWQWAADPTKPVADLALVHLNRRVPGQWMILTPVSTPVGAPDRLIGWGLTSFPDPAATPPVWLQQNDTHRLPASDCTGGFIGTGDECLGGGACYGDSGSPSLHDLVPGRPTLWAQDGIASRETDETVCGITVYTDLGYPPFRRWIFDTITGIHRPAAATPPFRPFTALDAAAQHRVNVLKAAKQYS